MKPNVGLLDRSLRVVIGLTLAILASAGLIGAWGWLGLVPLLTGAFAYCPAYGLFGWSSGPAAARESR